jgi:hypothetical protein
MPKKQQAQFARRTSFAALDGACEGILRRRDAHQAVAPCATLSAETGATASLTGLLVKLANADLFLDAAALDQLPKPTNRFLSGLFVTQCQLNHEGIAFRPWDRRPADQRPPDKTCLPYQL